MSGERAAGTSPIAVDLSTVMEMLTTPHLGSHPDDHLVGTVSVCKTPRDTAEIVASIISNKFGYDDDSEQLLSKALTVYFDKTGIRNEQMFAYLGEMSPLNAECVKDESGYEALTPPVMHCFQKAAALTARAFSTGFYLTRMVTFQQLE